ncbi:MAG TPA: vanadium-dependent haloperoxidase [Chitinophagaceae bacterium]
MDTRMKIFTVAALVIALFTAACNKNTHPELPGEKLPGKVILDWNTAAYNAMGGQTNQHSLMAACTYAILHAAMHDAINATQPTYETYAFHEKDALANPEVAAASAAHRILKVSFPGSGVDTVLNNYLAIVPEGESKTRGINLGINAANAILSMGYNGNAALNPIAPPEPALQPGDYLPVPPFDFIFAPFWENSKLFALETKDQFRCPPPPALTSEVYTTDFNEVKSVGMANSSTRTNDQTFFAKYWYEFSEQGWNRIARVMAEEKQTGLFTTARLFALLHFAMADAYTAGWDSKLYYNFWRPYTAIRLANTDGNANTAQDTGWLSSEITPPIQDYPSTHSALGNAAASVLAYFFGDNTGFTMSSPTAVPAGASRSFTSFSQAANENAESRVMAGIHFRFSCNAGLDLGKKIGEWTVKNHLQPVQ